MRQVFGYEYEQTPSGYVVLPARLEARVFHIDYLNLRREGNSRTRISAGDNLRSSNSSNGGEAGQEQDRNTPGSIVNTSEDTDFWKEIGIALGSIIGTDGGRKVVVSPQSNIVVVRALPAELARSGSTCRRCSSMVRQVIMRRSSR